MSRLAGSRALRVLACLGALMGGRGRAGGAPEGPVESCSRALAPPAPELPALDQLGSVLRGCAGLFDRKLCSDAIERASRSATPEGMLRLSLDGCAVAYCPSFESAQPSWCSHRSQQLEAVLADFLDFLARGPRWGEADAASLQASRRLSEVVARLARAVQRERRPPPRGAPIIALHAGLRNVSAEIMEPGLPIRAWAVSLTDPHIRTSFLNMAREVKDAAEVHGPVVLKVSAGLKAQHLRYFIEGLGPDTQVYVVPL